MDIRLLDTSEQGKAWNTFLDGHQGSTVFHRWEWRDIYSRTFGFQPRFWAAFEGDQIIAVLPAVVMSSITFQKHWLSLPFVQAAGPLHIDASQESLFLEQVQRQEQTNGIRYFQIRANRQCSLPGSSKLMSYVTMIVDTSAGADAVWKSTIHVQKRSQVRKARKNNIESVAGHYELIDDFYRIWTERINQLGTPVFPKSFFSNIVSTFGEDAWIQVVLDQGKVVGVMLLLRHKQCVFDPWAATKFEYNRVGANSLLYWAAIEEACNRGAQAFDMGRSEHERGTYNFKREWGAQPYHLSYLYLPARNVEKSAGDKFSSFIKIWRRLPKGLINIIGPACTRFLTDL